MRKQPGPSSGFPRGTRGSGSGRGPTLNSEFGWWEGGRALEPHLPISAPLGGGGNAVFVQDIVQCDLSYLGLGFDESGLNSDP